MATILHVIFVNTSPSTNERVLKQLVSAGFDPVWRIAENENDLRSTLRHPANLILNASSVPGIDAKLPTQNLNALARGVPIVSLPDLADSFSVSNLGALVIQSLQASKMQLPSRDVPSNPVTAANTGGAFALTIELLRFAMDHLPSAVVVYDSDLRYLYLNKSALEFFKMSQNAILGYTDQQVFSSGLVIPYLPFLRRAAETHSAQYGECEIIKGAETLSIAVRYVPLLDEHGQLENILGIIDDLTKVRTGEREREQLLEQIRAGRERLQVLSRRLIELQEIERRHIARELHDEIGQALTAVNFSLHSLQSGIADQKLHSQAEASQRIVEQIMTQVHDLALDLRPPMLDDLGLASALQWYVERQTASTGIQCEFIADPPDVNPPSDIKTTCYRLVQEALTNVLRHAKAHHIQVELRRRAVQGAEANGAEELVLTIQDDGIGFDVSSTLKRSSRSTNLGLLGMHERVVLAGGDLEISSEPLHGTLIRARFPLFLDESPGLVVERRHGRRHAQ